MSDKDKGSGDIVLKGPIDLDLVKDLQDVHSKEDTAEETGSSAEETDQAFEDASSEGSN